MKYQYDYARPAVTVDAIVFRPTSNQSYEVLLIQRKNEPFKGLWAFPGGFVDENEDPDLSVHRELEEETKITGQEFQQLGFWGRPGRDPRGHTVSLVYWGISEDPTLQATAADDAQKAEWFPIDELPELAFDHGEIMLYAMRKIDL